MTYRILTNSKTNYWLNTLPKYALKSLFRLVKHASHAPIYIVRVVLTLSWPWRLHFISTLFLYYFLQDAMDMHLRLQHRTPRIAIASTENRPNQDLLAHRNHQHYAHKHGYTAILQSIDLVSPRYGVWNKIPLAMDLLFPKDASKAFDWVWMLDYDAFIMNTELTIEAHVLNYAKKERLNQGKPWRTCDGIITIDFNNLNAGSFFLRRSAWTKMYLEKVWNLSQDTSIYNWEQWHEQAVMIDLYWNSTEIQHHFQVVPQELINSYQYRTKRQEVMEEVLEDFGSLSELETQVAAFDRELEEMNRRGDYRTELRDHLEEKITESSLDIKLTPKPKPKEKETAESTSERDPSPEEDWTIMTPQELQDLEARRNAEPYWYKPGHFVIHFPANKLFMRKFKENGQIPI